MNNNSVLVVSMIFDKSLAIVDFSTEPLNGGLARIIENFGWETPPF
jgi:hypothetical protein